MIAVVVIYNDIIMTYGSNIKKKRMISTFCFVYSYTNANIKQNKLQSFNLILK
jgi:hypothetical protein